MSGTKWIELVAEFCKYVHPLRHLHNPSIMSLKKEYRNSQMAPGGRLQILLVKTTHSAGNHKWFVMAKLAQAWSGAPGGNKLLPMCCCFFFFFSHHHLILSSLPLIYFPLASRFCPFSLFFSLRLSCRDLFIICPALQMANHWANNRANVFLYHQPASRAQDR